MPKTYVAPSPAEQVALQNLNARIGFAPTVLYGRGMRSNILHRLAPLSSEAVYAVVPNGPSVDGVREFTLYVASVPPTLRKSRARHWTAAQRVAQSARIKQMWATERAKKQG